MVGILSGAMLNFGGVCDFFDFINLATSANGAPFLCLLLAVDEKHFQT